MNAVVQVPKRTSLIEKIAHKYSVDPEKMLVTLKATAFKGDVSTEQMMALLIVADQYDLNPWTKEIFAFPDRNNGIVPVVGVDGWSRIINGNPQFDGMEFREGDPDASGVPAWIECVIYRKDRSHPVSVKEYFAEVRRDVGPWKTHPRRMLRHKSMIQCARLAFGFGGIYDQDEAERIVDVTPISGNPRDGIETADPSVVDGYVARVADILAMDVEETEHAKLIFALHQEICSDAAVYSALFDALKARKICTAAAFRALVAMGSKLFQERTVDG